MFKIYSDPESPHEGGGVFKRYGEPESPSTSEGCGRYLKFGIAKRGGVFKMYEEPESPNDGRA